jgi:hypothetical protein
MKEIIIKKIANTENSFIAYLKNPLLKASFSVCFMDSITGAIALNEFFQMIKFRYSKENFEFVISDKTVKIQNESLLNQIVGEKNERIRNSYK